ncbi:uncharacterized protein LOC119513867 [Choloepus didactylus]|uniref:uncharacterized protein LOC119513867 n=1 Tax=Choloepus didactylus TaxID=27675 RepID=UPI0018A0D718|nr:uncharacterized protein LOC119513867 [Choloepus didactylus]
MERLRVKLARRDCAADSGMRPRELSLPPLCCPRCPGSPGALGVEAGGAGPPLPPGRSSKCRPCDLPLAALNGSIGAERGSGSTCPGLRGPCGGTTFPSCSLDPQQSHHCGLNQNQPFGGPFRKVPQVQGGGRRWIKNRLSLRGSWLLRSSHKPKLPTLFPADPKGNPQEETGVQSRDPEETAEPKFKIRHLEAEGDSPVVPAPCPLDNAPLGPGPHGLPGAVTFLWPLGLVLAQPPPSPRRFQRLLLLRACLQLPCCGPGRFSVQRGQFRQDGVTSVRARPQASARVHVRKSLLPFASVRPEVPGAARGFNLITEERLCPLLGF